MFWAKQVFCGKNAAFFVCVKFFFALEIFVVIFDSVVNVKCLFDQLLMDSK